MNNVSSFGEVGSLDDNLLQERLLSCEKISDEEMSLFDRIDSSFREVVCMYEGIKSYTAQIDCEYNSVAGVLSRSFSELVSVFDFDGKGRSEKLRKVDLQRQQALRVAKRCLHCGLRVLGALKTSLEKSVTISNSSVVSTGSNRSSASEQSLAERLEKIKTLEQRIGESYRGINPLLIRVFMRAESDSFS